MAKSLPLVQLPTPSLRERSTEVDPARIGTPEFQTYLDDLTETMFVEDGIGIASSQVGKNWRVFIVNEPQGPVAYINPEIIKRSEATQDSEEGCLSVPGVWGMVKRSKRVTLRALNRHGRRVEVEGRGMTANVYQHELDHLDGILFVDRAYRTEKARASRHI